jgi:hypothetical protein
VYRLLLARDALAPMDTLRLRFPGNHDYFDMEDVKMWIRHALKRNARVIQLNGHHNSFVGLYGIDFVSRHLKVLKLSFVCVYDTNFWQLSSGCPCLEELEFKSCLVDTSHIIFASLKSLIMVMCDFIWNVTVDCLNLMVVQCVAPQVWVPLFKNLGSLVTASVMLDEDSYSDSVDTFDDSDESSDDSGYSSDDIEDNYDYGSDINSDTDTYEYSEIANASEDWQFGNCYDGHGSSKGSTYHDCSASYAIIENKRSGGQSVLHSLSNAQCLELLGHSGEVYSLTCC